MSPSMPGAASDRARDHFRLYQLSAVAQLVEGACQAFGGLPALLEQNPFLKGYLDELPLNSRNEARWWQAAIAVFESEAETHLPIRALRDGAGLDHQTLTLLMTVGLPEEDPRFGSFFDAAQGSTTQLASFGLLDALRRDGEQRGNVRSNLRRLRELGLVRVRNLEAPRSTWSLQVNEIAWDALKGEADRELAPWLTFVARARLTTLDAYVAPAELQSELSRIPALFASRQLCALVVRGPRRSGRRTALGAIAHALGRGLLIAGDVARPDDERWGLLQALGLLLDALPAVLFEPAPGEAVTLPAPRVDAPLCAVIPQHGGVGGAGCDGALTLSIDTPPPAERARHWAAALGADAGPDLEEIALRFRFTSGRIRRTAPLARTLAELDGRSELGLDDVRRAHQLQHRHELETLASLSTCAGSWASLALAPETLRDLRDLEARCRHREKLADRAGSTLRVTHTVGVRALFQGPSGAGKTLAARVLGAELGKDVYRLDLAATVSKYIGETEKNLHQVLARAEELDVILLLDEGDALLGQRTAVQTSVDRYSNLETNYLLQRLETFEGIVIVTTNAAEHIDRAFARRMDFVVEFRAPEAPERHAIWQMHLPVEHAIDSSYLRDVAVRCSFSGGQIKNVVLHALLLAAESAELLHNQHLEAAVLREYRKTGAVCPLRNLSVVSRSTA